MRSIFNYILCLCALCGCKQELCEWSSLSDRSSLYFDVDWSESGLEPSQIANLSAYGFPKDGSAPYLRVSGDVESAYISLPEGEYSMLLFNDIVGDIKGVKFCDMESYDVCSAQTIDPTISIERISAWRTENYTVLPSMVNCSYCGEQLSERVIVEVAPLPLTTQCIVNLRIENINNAQSVQGSIMGLASGAYLASQQRIEGSDESLYNIIFSSVKLDPSSTTDGVATAEITTFGKSPDDGQAYSVEIDVTLHSGESLHFTRDISSQVEAQDNTQIIIDLTSSDNLISLPQGNGTGFGVEGWGDRESIDLM